MKLRALAIKLVLCGVILPGAAHAQSDAITGAASVLAANAHLSWGLDYAKENRNVAVQFKPTGFADVVRQIRAHNVDFGANDYAMNADDLKKHDLIQFPTMVGAVVPVININGVKSGQIRLTGAVLAAIFAGRITNWNDPDIAALNAGTSLPNLAIKRIVRADESGSTATFTEYLSKADPNWAARFSKGLTITWGSGVEAVAGGEAVASAVLATNGAISYVSANQVARAKLSHVLLQNRKMEFVAPTNAALAAAALSNVGMRDDKLTLVDTDAWKAWPMTDATYILVERNPKNAERASEVLRFFYWAFTRAGTMANEAGHVALPISMQARVVASFRQVRDAQGNVLDYTTARLGLEPKRNDHKADRLAAVFRSGTTQ